MKCRSNCGCKTARTVVLNNKAYKYLSSVAAKVAHPADNADELECALALLYDALKLDGVCRVARGK